MLLLIAAYMLAKRMQDFQVSDLDELADRLDLHHVVDSMEEVVGADTGEHEEVVEADTGEQEDVEVQDTPDSYH